MYIDAHVHDRDGKQGYKGETVAHALSVAKDSGLDAILVMPNTDPPIIGEEEVKARLELRKNAKIPEVFYGMYIGATANPEQLKRAVELSRKYQEVVGIKLYAGESVGNLAVVNPMNQMIVYGTLAQEGFEKVLAVHAEKEAYMNKSIWSSVIPISHCIARPPQAEIESIKDQVLLAKYTSYKGKLHIAHISTHDGVMLVDRAKKEGLDLSCGVCPHHLVYSMGEMFKPNGIIYKVNPPLRSAEEPNLLLEDLRNGLIDFIETDHAPHSKKEKLENPFMSGIVGLWAWRIFEEYLRQNNFTEERIVEVTFSKPRGRFNLDVSRSNRPIKNRSADYPINHYNELEKLIGWN
ncbi:MAG: dihydroorotase [Nanoarchaeota archaeon]|nr:dihydroorotase [Nanoarchaeota archaeon]